LPEIARPAVLLATVEEVRLAQPPAAVYGQRARRTFLTVPFMLYWPELLLPRLGWHGFGAGAVQASGVLLRRLPLSACFRAARARALQRLLQRHMSDRRKRDYRTHNTAPALSARFVHEQ